MSEFIIFLKWFIWSLLAIEVLATLRYYLHEDPKDFKRNIICWFWFQVFLFTIPLCWIVPVADLSSYAFERMG